MKSTNKRKPPTRKMRVTTTSFHDEHPLEVNPSTDYFAKLDNKNNPELNKPETKKVEEVNEKSSEEKPTSSTSSRSSTPITSNKPSTTPRDSPSTSRVESNKSPRNKSPKSKSPKTKTPKTKPSKTPGKEKVESKKMPIVESKEKTELVKEEETIEEPKQPEKEVEIKFSKKIVILGAGTAGLLTLSELNHLAEKEMARLFLVEPEVSYIPSESIIYALGDDTPIDTFKRDYLHLNFPYVTLIHDSPVFLDTEQRVIHIKSGSVKFDHLIVSNPSVPTSDNIPGILFIF